MMHKVARPEFTGMGVASNDFLSIDDITEKDIMQIFSEKISLDEFTQENVVEKSITIDGEIMSTGPSYTL